jgi:hypothetical protein
MGLASCLAAAFLAMLVWAEKPSLGHGVLFGFCLALALLAKLTTLVFFPAGAAIALLFYLAAERPGLRRLKQLAIQHIGSFAVAVQVCLFIWWGAFFFSVGRVPFWPGVLPAQEYFVGIYLAWLHAQGGHSAYLLGQTSFFGWWYYFPVALAVKTPLALLALVGAGTAVCWNRRRSLRHLLPFAFMLGVLLPSMRGSVNIGVRHVLPIYLGFAIVGALGLESLLKASESRRWSGVLAVALSLWLVVTGAIHHPNYLPYFNELVPYPQDRVICDSDYDWGQDTSRLAVRLRELGATEVNYGLIGEKDIAFLQAYSGLPRIVPIDPLKPAVGWTAICPTLDHSRKYGLDDRYPGVQPWYRRLPVRERVGTIDLLYVPPSVAR